MANRVCTIDGGGGDVIIRLRANNGLRAAAELEVTDGGGASRDMWKMASGDSGSVEHTLTGVTITVPSLEANALRWAILVCASIPAARAGAVDIDVLQDGKTCPLVPAAHWALTNTPDCDSGSATPINAALTFKLKSQA